MPVAKSYQKYSLLGNPYSSNGKQYIKIDFKGSEKVVRWYSDSEYAKMYPTETSNVTPTINKDSKYYRPQKDVLGFENGYVTIFIGITEDNEDWFRQSAARYTRWWGWYFASTDIVPEILPEGVKAIKLNWERVCADADRLLPEGQLERAISEVLYEPTESEHIGNIGERLDFVLTVKKALKIETNYGSSTMHIMSDYDGNTFIWTTAAKTLTVGKEYEVKGTIKAHSIYHGDKQTILTRCSVKE